MISLVRIVVVLVSDAFRLVLLLLRPSAQIHAENLVLRKQLAQYIERGVKPRRVDAATRISLALLTRLREFHTFLRFESRPIPPKPVSRATLRLSAPSPGTMGNRELIGAYQGIYQEEQGIFSPPRLRLNSPVLLSPTAAQPRPS
jgi:hypothetical protein